MKNYQRKAINRKWLILSAAPILAAIIIGSIGEFVGLPDFMQTHSGGVTTVFLLLALCVIGLVIALVLVPISIRMLINDKNLVTTSNLIAIGVGVISIITLPVVYLL